MKKSILIFLFFLINLFLYSTSISVNYGGGSSDLIVAEAKKMLGVPYVWGGITSRGVDCSGLVYNVYEKTTGLKLPRRVTDLLSKGSMVKSNLLPGDLVFFDTEGRGKATHVGISIGGLEFIHAASAGRRQGVIISALNEKYYKTRYLGAKRVIYSNYPVVELILDDKKLTKKVPSLLSSGVPLYFRLKGTWGSSRYITFKTYRNNKEVMTRRVKLTKAGEKIWFVPQGSGWTVTVSDDIKGKLAELQFIP